MSKRITFEIDPYTIPEGRDGKPLPEQEERYRGNEYRTKGGKAVSYADYLAYYGDPGRHVVISAAVQEQCSHCGTWGESTVSLGGIDLMDDDPDADRVGTFTEAEIATWPEASYLRSVAEDLFAEVE